MFATIATFPKAAGVRLVRRIRDANRAGTSHPGTYLTQQGETFRVVDAKWTAACGGMVQVRRLLDGQWLAVREAAELRDG